MVKNYFVFVTRVSSSGDSTSSDGKFFSSNNAALRYYRFLVASVVMSINDASISFSENDESYFKLKTRISSGNNTTYVYLCKLL